MENRYDAVILSSVEDMAQQFDSLNFVIFVHGKPSGTALELWNKAFESTPPENFQQLGTGGSQAAARKGDINVAIVTQLNRIDVVISPVVVMPFGGAPAASEPALEPAIDVGLELIAKLSPGENVHRPAVVFQLTEECESVADSLRKTSDRAGGASYPSEATDLSYQTIVPTKSEAEPRLKINRLCRWNTGRRQVVRLDMTTGSMQNDGGTLATMLYLDVFTEEQPSATQENFSKLFAEVVGEAKKILSRGYNALS